MFEMHTKTGMNLEHSRGEDVHVKRELSDQHTPYSTIILVPELSIESLLLLEWFPSDPMLQFTPKVKICQEPV